MSFIRKLEKSEVRFLLLAEEEIEGPDRDFDPECLETIRKRIEEGDVWAWCTAIVKAVWTNTRHEVFTGEATLGACSYDSAEDFKKDSGQYESLCDEALADLQEHLNGYAESLESLITMQSFEAWLVEQIHEE